MLKIILKRGTSSYSILYGNVPVLYLASKSAFRTKEKSADTNICDWQILLKLKLKIEF
jgi:hypothetical protein